MVDRVMADEAMRAAPATVRIERLQRQLAAQGLDALICLKPENSFYLSGFNPIIYSHPVVAILPASGAPVILVHALRDNHARASSSVQDIRLFGAWSTKRTMGPNWLAALGEILAELGLSRGRLGFEADYLPVNRLRAFEELLPGAELLPGDAVIDTARLVKDDGEIANLRRASRIADAGMAIGLQALRDGGNEREISIAAMAEMNAVWARDYPDTEVCDFGSLEGGAHNGLWCWCLTGDRIAINADNPTTRRPQRGEIAQIHIWSVCDGMHAENERAVAVGTLPDAQRRAYDAILQIRAHVRPLLRPGTPIRELYEAARAEYVRLGYGAYVPGRIGHGLGLGAHEHPSLDGRSEVVLAAGMAITLEPNLRIPEWGGLQHSDTVLITAAGAETLTATESGFLGVPGPVR
jgi:Xaa-Pro dipeptidase